MINHIKPGKYYRRDGKLVTVIATDVLLPSNIMHTVIGCDGETITTWQADGKIMKDTVSQYDIVGENQQ